MKRDKDEMLIKEAFEEMQTPEFDILQAMAQEAKSQKSPRPRIFRRSFVVAFAIMLVAVTSVAAAYYFTIIDHIHEVVGEGMAEVINPVYAQAEHLEQEWWRRHVWSTEAVAENDLIFEVVATGVFDNMVDVYIIMQDLRGYRLEGESWIVVASLTRQGAAESTRNWGMLAPGHQDVLERFEDGRLLVRQRFAFETPVVTGNMQYDVRMIRYNFSTSYYTTIDIDLTDLLSVQTIDDIITGVLPATHSLDAHMLRARRTFSDPSVNARGDFERLAPNQLEIGANNPEINAAVTGIGIINGRLHVQTYAPVGLHFNDHVLVRLRREGDNCSPMLPAVTFSFNLRSDGTFYSSDERDDSFEEWVFDIDLDNLQEYSLSADFSAFNYIPVAAAFSLDVVATDIANKTIATDLNLNMDLDTRICCSGSEVFLVARVDSLRVSPISAMLDGSFVNVLRDSHGNVQTYSYPPISRVPVLPSSAHRWIEGTLLEIHSAEGIITATLLNVDTDLGRWNNTRPTDTFRMVFELDETIDIGGISAIYIAGIRVY